jgi:ATP-dependent DNA helicase 2 subunit 1
VPAKRARTAKASAEPEGVSDDAIKKAFVSDALGRFTVPVLKEWAERKHIPIHGRKAELVERIQAYFESK